MSGGSSSAGTSSTGKKSRSSQHLSTTECSLCHTVGPGIRGEGDFLPPFRLKNEKRYVHEFCARFSPQVYKRDGKIQGVVKEVKRGAQLPCPYCKRRGATIGCISSQCRRSFHFPCAMVAGCHLDLEQFLRGEGGLYCPDHLGEDRARNAIPATTPDVWTSVFADDDDLESNTEQNPGREEDEIEVEEEEEEGDDDREESTLAREDSAACLAPPSATCAICRGLDDEPADDIAIPESLTAPLANALSSQASQSSSSTRSKSKAKQAATEREALSYAVRILICHSCGATAHGSCYGVSPQEVARLLKDKTTPFFCDLCLARTKVISDPSPTNRKVNEMPECSLCRVPRWEGQRVHAFKRGRATDSIEEEEWCHLICGILGDGAEISDISSMSPVIMTSSSVPSASPAPAPTCQGCRANYLTQNLGSSLDLEVNQEASSIQASAQQEYLVKCAVPDCPIYYHPVCVIQGNLYLSYFTEEKEAKEGEENAQNGEGQRASFYCRDHTPVALYCVCKQPFDEKRFMIECDSCKDWFHGTCVHVEEPQDEEEKDEEGSDTEGAEGGKEGKGSGSEIEFTCPTCVELIAAGKSVAPDVVYHNLKKEELYQSSEDTPVRSLCFDVGVLQRLKLEVNKLMELSTRSLNVDRVELLLEEFYQYAPAQCGLSPDIERISQKLLSVISQAKHFETEATRLVQESSIDHDEDSGYNDLEVQRATASPDLCRAYFAAEREQCRLLLSTAMQAPGVRAIRVRALASLQRRADALAWMQEVIDCLKEQPVDLEALETLTRKGSSIPIGSGRGEANVLSLGVFKLDQAKDWKRKAERHISFHSFLRQSKGRGRSFPSSAQGKTGTSFSFSAELLEGEESGGAAVAPSRRINLLGLFSLIREAKEGLRVRCAELGVLEQILGDAETWQRQTRDLMRTYLVFSHSSSPSTIASNIKLDPQTARDRVEFLLKARERIPVEMPEEVYLKELLQLILWQIKVSNIFEADKESFESRQEEERISLSDVQLLLTEFQSLAENANALPPLSVELSAVLVKSEGEQSAPTKQKETFVSLSHTFGKAEIETLRSWRDETVRWVKKLAETIVAALSSLEGKSKAGEGAVDGQESDCSKLSLFASLSSRATERLALTKLIKEAETELHVSVHGEIRVAKDVLSLLDIMDKTRDIFGEIEDFSNACRSRPWSLILFGSLSSVPLDVDNIVMDVRMQLKRLLTSHELLESTIKSLGSRGSEREKSGQAPRSSSMTDVSLLLLDEWKQKEAAYVKQQKEEAEKKEEDRKKDLERQQPQTPVSTLSASLPAPIPSPSAVKASTYALTPFSYGNNSSKPTAASLASVPTSPSFLWSLSPSPTASSLTPRLPTLAPRPEPSPRDSFSFVSVPSTTPTPPFSPSVKVSAAVISTRLKEKHFLLRFLPASLQEDLFFCRNTLNWLDRGLELAETQRKLKLYSTSSTSLHTVQTLRGEKQSKEEPLKIEETVAEQAASPSAMSPTFSPDPSPPPSSPVNASAATTHDPSPSMLLNSPPVLAWEKELSVWVEKGLQLQSTAFTKDSTVAKRVESQGIGEDEADDLRKTLVVQMERELFVARKGQWRRQVERLFLASSSSATEEIGDRSFRAPSLHTIKELIEKAENLATRSVAEKETKESQPETEGEKELMQEMESLTSWTNKYLTALKERKQQGIQLQQRVKDALTASSALSVEELEALKEDLKLKALSIISLPVEMDQISFVIDYKLYQKGAEEQLALTPSSPISFRDLKALHDEFLAFKKRYEKLSRSSSSETTPLLIQSPSFPLLESLVKVGKEWNDRAAAMIKCLESGLQTSKESAPSKVDSKKEGEKELSSPIPLETIQTLLSDQILHKLRFKYAARIQELVAEAEKKISMAREVLVNAVVIVNSRFSFDKDASANVISEQADVLSSTVENLKRSRDDISSLNITSSETVRLISFANTVEWIVSALRVAAYMKKAKEGGFGVYPSSLPTGSQMSDNGAGKEEREEMAGNLLKLAEEVKKEEQGEGLKELPESVQSLKALITETADAVTKWEKQVKTLFFDPWIRFDDQQRKYTVTSSSLLLERVVSLLRAEEAGGAASQLLFLVNEDSIYMLRELKKEIEQQGSENIYRKEILSTSSPAGTAAAPLSVETNEEDVSQKKKAPKKKKEESPVCWAKFRNCPFWPARIMRKVTPYISSKAVESVVDGPTAPPEDFVTVSFYNFPLGVSGYARILSSHIRSWEEVKIPAVFLANNKEPATAVNEAAKEFSPIYSVRNYVEAIRSASQLHAKYVTPAASTSVASGKRSLDVTDKEKLKKSKKAKLLANKEGKDRTQMESASKTSGKGEATSKKRKLPSSSSSAREVCDCGKVAEEGSRYCSLRCIYKYRLDHLLRYFNQPRPQQQNAASHTSASSPASLTALKPLGSASSTSTLSKPSSLPSVSATSKPPSAGPAPLSGNKKLSSPAGPSGLIVQNRPLAPKPSHTPQTSTGTSAGLVSKASSSTTAKRAPPPPSISVVERAAKQGADFTGVSAGPRVLPVRLSSRKILLKSLSPEGVESTKPLENLAAEIELALYAMFPFGPISSKVKDDYKARARSLAFNLSKNEELRVLVVSREISPEKLCNMLPHELANKDLKTWRAQLHEEHIKQISLGLEETPVPLGSPTTPANKRRESGEEKQEESGTEAAAEGENGKVQPDASPATDSLSLDADLQIVEAERGEEDSEISLSLRDTSQMSAIESEAEKLPGSEKEIEEEGIQESSILQEEGDDSAHSIPEQPEIEVAEEGNPLVTPEIVAIDVDGEDGTEEDHDVELLDVAEESESEQMDDDEVKDNQEAKHSDDVGLEWEGRLKQDFPHIDLHLSASVVTPNVTLERNILPPVLTVAGRLRFPRLDTFLYELLSRSTSRIIVVLHFNPAKSSNLAAQAAFQRFSTEEAFAGVSMVVELSGDDQLYIVPPSALSSTTNSLRFLKERYPDPGVYGILVSRRITAEKTEKGERIGERDLKATTIDNAVAEAVRQGGDSQSRIQKVKALLDRVDLSALQTLKAKGPSTLSPPPPLASATLSLPAPTPFFSGSGLSLVPVPSSSISSQSPAHKPSNSSIVEREMFEKLANMCALSPNQEALLCVMRADHTANDELGFLFPEHPEHAVFLQRVRELSSRESGPSGLSPRTNSVSLPPHGRGPPAARSNAATTSSSSLDMLRGLQKGFEQNRY